MKLCGAGFGDTSEESGATTWCALQKSAGARCYLSPESRVVCGCVPIEVQLRRPLSPREQKSPIDAEGKSTKRRRSILGVSLRQLSSSIAADAKTRYHETQPREYAVGEVGQP